MWLGEEVMLTHRGVTVTVAVGFPVAFPFEAPVATAVYVLFIGEMDQRV